MSTNNGYPTTATAASPPTNTQYINLSDYMYQAFNTPYPDTLTKNIHFAPLLRSTLLHPTPSPVVSNAPLKGLYAEAFISTNKTGPKTVIIAYEGTQLSEAKKQDHGLFTAAELVDDAQLFKGEEADSLASSASFAKQVIAFAGKLGIGAQNIYVTGHSLGAAEADYAASQTGLAGVTFAAPGISTQYTGVYPSVPNAGEVVNYVDAGDPIGNYAADGNDTLKSVLASDNIEHYGGAKVLPNVLGEIGLKAADGAYAVAKAANSTAGEVAALAGAIFTNGKNHLLPRYAADLGSNGNSLPLYLQDSSTNSENGFFPTASAGTSQASVDASYIAAALTGNGVPQSSSASSSTGNTSVLAASSDTSAHAMGVKAHAG